MEKHRPNRAAAYGLVRKETHRLTDEFGVPGSFYLMKQMQTTKGENVTHLLKDKTAIVYGAGGGLGSAVARTFARERAAVVLAGRTRASLEAVADSIEGIAEVAVVDALDEKEVEAHVERVVANHGTLDISFNLISRGDVQNIPLLQMKASDMLRASLDGLKSNFLTARAAGNQMVRQGSGVILHLNSGSGAGAQPGMGSTGPADAATESFMRYLAAEIGPAGVRVCGIWTAGVADTLTEERLRAVGGEATPDPAKVVEMISSMSALRRAPVSSEVAETAAFLASDRASGITGDMSNVTSGLVLR